MKFFIKLLISLIVFSPAFIGLILAHILDYCYWKDKIDEKKYNIYTDID
jgi:hypothetical protein